MTPHKLPPDWDGSPDMLPPGLYDTGKHEIRTDFDPVRDEFVTGTWRLLIRIDKKRENMPLPAEACERAYFRDNDGARVLVLWALGERVAA